MRQALATVVTALSRHEQTALLHGMEAHGLRTSTRSVARRRSDLTDSASFRLCESDRTPKHSRGTDRHTISGGARNGVGTIRDDASEVLNWNHLLGAAYLCRRKLLGVVLTSLWVSQI